MAGIAQLRAMVGLDTRAYKAGANQINAANRRMMSQFQAVGRVIGVSLSVAGLVAIGRHLARWSSEMSIAARNAGLLTSEFIAFNRVGLQNNITTQQTAQLLARMQTELFSAARGSDQSAEKFERMGLSVGDLVRMRPAEMMQAVAQAATSAGIPLENMAELFGQRLGPQARTALEQIARDGLPAVDDALGVTVDRIEYMGGAFARNMDQARGWLLRVANAAIEMTRDVGAFFGGMFAGRDDMNAIMAGIDAARDRRIEVEREIDKITQSRIDQQKRDAEELARIYERSQQRQMENEQRMARERIQSAERAFRALSPDASQMERMGAFFGGGDVGHMAIAQRDRETVLWREQNQILERMDTRLQELNEKTQAARGDL